MEAPARTRLRDRKPSRRQIYALAAALCERLGWEFPETAEDASDLIEAVRLEIGHPRPSLDDDEAGPGRRS